MSKSFIIIVSVVLILGALVFVVVVNNTEESNEPKNYPTVSTTPEDYQNCVDQGGEVFDGIAPERCVINKEAYYNGNF